MRVRQIMTPNPVCCGPNTSLEDIAGMMSGRDCGAIPVIDELGHPIGIITDRDIVVRSIASGRDPMVLEARDCMTAPAITIADSAALHDCIDLLDLTQLRRVIVVDTTGACCGIVAQADIARTVSKRSAGDLVREVSKPTAPAFASV